MYSSHNVFSVLRQKGYRLVADTTTSGRLPGHPRSKDIISNSITIRQRHFRNVTCSQSQCDGDVTCSQSTPTQFYSPIRHRNYRNVTRSQSQQEDNVTSARSTASQSASTVGHFHVKNATCLQSQHLFNVMWSHNHPVLLFSPIRWCHRTNVTCSLSHRVQDVTCSHNILSSFPSLIRHRQYKYVTFTKSQHGFKGNVVTRPPSSIAFANSFSPAHQCHVFAKSIR